LELWLPLRLFIRIRANHNSKIAGKWSMLEATRVPH